MIVPPQTRTTGEDFSGLDLFLALIDQGGGQMTRVQYVAQGDSDPVAFQDFMAWLAENAAKLAQPAPEPTPEATAEATAEATEAAAATEEATAAGATEEAIATQEAIATEEAAPAATQEATAEATVEATAKSASAPAATQEAAAISTTPSATNWVEISPGQVLYARNPEASAQINYTAFNTEDFVTSSQLEMPAADSETPALDILNQMKAKLDGELTTMGLAVADDAFTGPEIETISGVETALVRMKIGPQTVGGQQFPGIDLVLALIDHGDGTITAMQYMLQGPPDDTIYEDVRAWLEDNAERLATLEPEAAATEAAPGQ